VGIFGVQIEIGEQDPGQPRPEKDVLLPFLPRAFDHGGATIFFRSLLQHMVV
jgi:hypothetical protein